MPSYLSKSCGGSPSLSRSPQSEYGVGVHELPAVQVVGGVAVDVDVDVDVDTDLADSRQAPDTMSDVGTALVHVESARCIGGPFILPGKDNVRIIVKGEVGPFIGNITSACMKYHCDQAA